MLSLVPRKFLWLLLGVMCLTASWMYGHHQGTVAAMARANVIVQATANDGQESLHRLDQQEQELVRTQYALKSETAYRVSLQSKTTVLEKELLQNQLIADSDAAELAMYRRIANSKEPPKSLAVDSVKWIPSHPPEIELTLIQWRGRDVVSGQVVANLGFHESVATEDREDDPQDVHMAELDPVEFQFRFFQKLSIPVNTGRKMKPNFIEFRVKSEGKRSKTLVKRIEWTELAEIVD